VGIKLAPSRTGIRSEGLWALPLFQRCLGSAEQTIFTMLLIMLLLNMVLLISPLMDLPITIAPLIIMTRTMTLQQPVALIWRSFQSRYVSWYV
jgi:hypothetical protein